jgi:hypothetical protein
MGKCQHYCALGESHLPDCPELWAKARALPRYDPPVQHALVRESRGVMRCTVCDRLLSQEELESAKIVLPCEGRK